jgi:hypothetical protein
MRPLVKRLLVLAVMLVAAAGVQPAAQAPDPFLGTWQLNLMKSSFPGPPPVRPHVLSFEQNPDGSIVGLFFELDDLGKRTAAAKIVYRYDGKDYRDTDLPAGTPAPNTLAFTRTDPRTVDVIHKLNEGKAVFKERRVVSADGKTMTFTMTASDATGRTVSVIQVFDRL